MTATSMAQDKSTDPAIANNQGYGRFFLPLVGVLVWLPIVLCVTAPKIFGVMPVVLAVLGLGYYWHVNRKFPPFARDIAMVLAAMVALFAVGWFWAVAPEQVFPRAGKAAVLFATGLSLSAVAATLDDKIRAYLCRPIPALLGITAVLVIIEVWADYPFHRLLRGIGWDEKVRSHVINRGTVIMVTLLWPALLILLQKGKTLAAWGLALICTWATFETNSQSAWVGLSAAALAWLGMRQLPKKIVSHSFFAFFAVVTIFAPYLARDLYSLQPDTLVRWEAAAAAQRMEIWNDISPKIMEAPLIGWGADSTRMMDDLERTKVFYPPDVIWHPHNSALQLWIEMGLPGVLAGLAFVWLMLGRISRLPEAEAPFAFAAFITLMTVSFVGYSLWQGWFIGLFGFAAGLTTVALRKNRAIS